MENEIIFILINEKLDFGVLGIRVFAIIQFAFQETAGKAWKIKEFFK